MDVKNILKCFFLIMVIVFNTDLSYALDYDEFISDSDKNFEKTVPDYIQENFREFTGENFSAENIKKIKPQYMIKDLFRFFRRFLVRPFSFLGKALALSVIMGIVKILMNNFAETETESIFSLISALAAAGIFVSPVMNCVKSSVKSLETCNIFITGLAPIMGEIMMTMGMPLGAGAYNIALLGVCGAASMVIKRILIPLLGIYMAFCLVGSVFSENELCSLAGTVKKIILWILTFTMCIFTGVLAFQSFAGTAADSLAMRTARFAISGFVPIIGGAVSEAYGITLSCMGIIKSSLGIFGTASVLFCFLPVIADITGWYMVCSIAVFISSILDFGFTSRIFEVFSDGLRILLSFVFAYMVLAIIGAGLVIFMSTGV